MTATDAGNQPNTTLRDARLGLIMSQDDFARALRKAGAKSASKRLVQLYEAGKIRTPHARQIQALEKVTGLPLVALGFEPPAFGALVAEDGRGGHDVHHPEPDLAVNHPQHPAGAGRRYSGVWLSRYEYYSSTREETFAGLHYVVVLQHGNRLTVRSLAGSAASLLTMDITVDGPVLTGTWVEQTDPNGYYRGARYHGGIQMLAEPTGRRIVGKWVGFGKAMDINTGPWELVFESSLADKETLDRYNRRPPTD